MDFAWDQKIKRQEAGKQFEERNSALYWKVQGDNDDVDNLSENASKEESVQERIKWISGKSQFFSTVLIANQAFNGAQLKSNAFEQEKNPKDYDQYLKDISVTSSVDYSSQNPAPASFYFYFGPNRYALLSSYDQFSPNEDLHLTRLVSLGWTLFRWINSGIVMPVFNWLCKFGWSLGIVILVLTILLKLVLWPLTYKSYMSQAKMKILQPDIAAINEKYPDPNDAMKKQQKTMELYKQAGANPMGGCLPMLLQMPFLIAMFWFFPSSIDLRGQSFLWAPDLSAPDAIISLPFSIPHLPQSDFAAVPVTVWWEIGFMIFFSTFVAYYLIPVGQQRIRPTLVSMYGYLQPIIAIAVAIWTGMDRLTFTKILAALLVFTGVWVVNQSRAATPPASGRIQKSNND